MSIEWRATVRTPSKRKEKRLCVSQTQEWIINNLEEGAADPISTDLLYEYYCDTRHQEQRETKIAFARQIKKEFPRIKSRRLGPRYSRTTHWIGIRVKGPA